MARSMAWRWGEEGIAGISDDRQLLCFAVALWNKKDPIIKERYFGLTNYEGNHGEDVKEMYYYLDSTPTHSYMKMLYKYPQKEFPYDRLVKENIKRSRREPEFELMDTGFFDGDQYFDVFVEYAKAHENDILIRLTIHNRGDKEASLHVLPTLWFRNTWSWSYDDYKPRMMSANSGDFEVKPLNTHPVWWNIHQILKVIDNNWLQKRSGMCRALTYSSGQLALESYTLLTSVITCDHLPAYFYQAKKKEVKFRRISALTITASKERIFSWN